MSSGERSCPILPIGPREDPPAKLTIITHTAHLPGHPDSRVACHVAGKDRNEIIAPCPPYTIVISNCCTWMSVIKGFIVFLSCISKYPPPFIVFFLA